MKTVSLIHLLLLASFASVGAVLPTPALPQLAAYFSIASIQAGWVMTVYLLGYAFSQLFYGPIANRYGRRTALKLGVCIAILGGMVCIAATALASFAWYIVGRFVLAFGAAAGLVISMILIKDLYDATEARKVFAKVVLSFAIVPFVATALGGSLASFFGWKAIDVAMVFYSLVLLRLTVTLPETLVTSIPLSFQHLFSAYQSLVQSGRYLRLVLVFSIGSMTSYVFNALAPFITVKFMHLSSLAYGWLGIVPSVGILMGGWISNHYAARLSVRTLINVGLLLIIAGSGLLAVLFANHIFTLTSFYLAAVVMFCGASLLIPNASMEALASVADHANGASLMNAVTLLFSSVAVAMAAKGIGVSVVMFPLVVGVMGVVGLVARPK